MLNTPFIPSSAEFGGGSWCAVDKKYTVHHESRQRAGFFMATFNETRPGLVLGRQEYLDVLSPEQKRCYYLRRYVWPTAVWLRLAYFADLQEQVKTHLGAADLGLSFTYATEQFSRRPIHPKTGMSEFILQLRTDIARVATQNPSGRYILPRIQIPVPDLNDPFQWNGDLAQQRLCLVGNVARMVNTENPDAIGSYYAFLAAQQTYFGHVDQDMMSAARRISGC